MLTIPQYNYWCIQHTAYVYTWKTEVSSWDRREWGGRVECRDSGEIPRVCGRGKRPLCSGPSAWYCGRTAPHTVQELAPLQLLRTRKSGEKKRKIHGWRGGMLKKQCANGTRSNVRWLYLNDRQWISPTPHATSAQHELRRTVGMPWIQLATTRLWYLKRPLGDHRCVYFETRTFSVCPWISLVMQEAPSVHYMITCGTQIHNTTCTPTTLHILYKSHMYTS